MLGLLFLRYAEAKFAQAEKELKPKPGSRRKLGPDAFKARSVILNAEAATLQERIAQNVAEVLER